MAKMSKKQIDDQLHAIHDRLEHDCDQMRERYGKIREELENRNASDDELDKVLAEEMEEFDRYSKEMQMIRLTAFAYESRAPRNEWFRNCIKEIGVVNGMKLSRKQYDAFRKYTAERDDRRGMYTYCRVDDLYVKLHAYGYLTTIKVLSDWSRYLDD